MRDSGRRAALIAVLMVTVLAAWGCRRRAVVVNGGMTARQQEQLMSYAERHSGCSQAQLSPSLISSPPDVYTVTGCAQPLEYWQRCSRRRCRWERVEPAHEVASAMLQCPPHMVQQQPTQAPTQRVVAGCGRMVSLSMQCTNRDCAWVAVSPVQAQGGAAVAAAPAPQAQQQVVVASPQAQANPSAALQAQVQQQREAVLSCLDPGTTLVLSLRWTADGQVILQLPPELAGTAAEGCIQAALGALQVAAQQPGAVQVPLQ